MSQKNEWPHTQALEGGAQRLDDVCGVFSDNDPILTKMSLTAAAFFTEDMSTKRLAMLGFAGCRDLEPLLRAFVGFLLGHRPQPLSA